MASAAITEGMQRVAALIEPDTPYVGIGTGTGTPASSDTELDTETARTPATSTSVGGNQVDVRGYFPNAQTPTTIQEMGLFLNASATADSGSMLVRATQALSPGSADVLITIKVSIVAD